MDWTTYVKGGVSIDPAHTSGVGISQSARIHVEAGSAVHHQTMAAHARRLAACEMAPDYVDTVTGKRRPGKWSDVAQVGKVQPIGHGMLTKHAEYSVIVVPA